MDDTTKTHDNQEATGVVPRQPCPRCATITDVLVAGVCTTCWCDDMDTRAGIITRYFVTIDDAAEQEVSEEEWVSVERRAGFTSTTGHPDRPATSGFSASGLKGRTERSRPDTVLTPA